MGGLGTPRAAVVLLGASVCCIAVTAALGPSAAVPPLPGRTLHLPPYAAAADAPAALVSVLLAFAVLAGAAGLLVAARALRRGWAPDPRRLLGAGLLAVAALAVLPPVGSADAKSYAAYGRMAATGHDPYATTPQQRALAGDPVAASVERPWRQSPSVYGPVATAEAALVARVAGDSTHIAVGLLGLLNAAAFAGCGILLVAAAPKPDARREVTLLWLLNPLLLLLLVSGAHLDAIVAAAAVAALVVARRPLLAGGAVAAGALVKPTAAAAAAGLAWALHRTPRSLVALTVGAAVLAVPAYAAAGPHVLDQTRRASRFVSLATPWRPLADVLDTHWGVPPSRLLISRVAAVAALLLAAVVYRRLTEVPPAVRVTLALLLGYVFLAPYVLPWYDGLAWAPLLLAGSSPVLDRLMLLLAAHTGTLTLAYLPGRTTDLPSWLADTTHILRVQVAPVVNLVLVLGLVVACHRRDVSGTAERGQWRHD